MPDSSGTTITLHDVAQAAQVSVMTASRALNDSGRIARDTQRRVQEAAARLGYVPNASARRLKGGRTGVLGLIVHDLAPMFAEMANGASEAASESGLDVLLYTTRSNPGRERERVAMVRGGLADGLIIALPRSDDAYLRSLESSAVPVVLINHYAEGKRLSAVRGDNYFGARAAAEHLVGLGHRRIAFLSGDPLSGQSTERQRAYSDVMREAGLPERVVHANFLQRRAFEVTRELLEGPNPPTAVFAANDYSAYGAIDAVKDAGLRVPDDVSVVGFDDVPASAQMHPALTTVRHPFHDLGVEAAKLLLDLLAGRAEPGTVRELPSTLIVRASTAPPGASR